MELRLNIHGSSNVVQLLARGAGGQTADLQQWQSSTAAVKTRVAASGRLDVGNGLVPGDAASFQAIAGDNRSIVTLHNAAGTRVTGWYVTATGGGRQFYQDSTGATQIDLVVGTGITLGNSHNLILGTTTGTKIGTAAAQKLGFWNAAPVVQPTGMPAAATDLASVIALANHIRSNVLLATGLAT